MNGSQYLHSKVYAYQTITNSLIDLSLTKINIFAALVLASVLGLLVSTVWILTATPAPMAGNMSGMADMMRRMMGGQEISMHYRNPYIYLLTLTFGAVAIGGTFGLIYFLAYPEIKRAQKEVKTTAAFAESSASVEAVARTLKPDELKVFEILKLHGGKYLQKQIAKEVGLSRLKTHRIVARFAERGLVSVKEYGNTNEVMLAEWLQKREGESSP